MLTSGLPWRKWWCKREETRARPLVAAAGAAGALRAGRRRHRVVALAVPSKRAPRQLSRRRTRQQRAIQRLEILHAPDLPEESLDPRQHGAIVGLQREHQPAREDLGVAALAEREAGVERDA